MSHSQLYANANAEEMKRQRSSDSGKRRSTTSPQSYQEAVQQRAERSQDQTLYAGILFQDLDMYLKRSSTPDTIHSSETPVEDAPYATVVSIGVPSGHGDGIPSRQSFSNPKECAEAIKRRTSSESQVIFLRGYPSPEWIKYIGGCCRISDLEFFRWNLRFQCRRDWCLSPPLSSASSKIIKLRFVTIGSRESSGKKQATVDELREKADRGMQSYDHDLRIGSSIKKGDSIVRDYFVLDERHVVIEQEMVICINKVGNNWTTVILTDAGHPLSTGPHSPWASTGKDKPSPPWKLLYPTILPLPRLPSRKSFPCKNRTTERSEANFQSAFLIPEEFGLTLDGPTMKSDPFYSLNELFKFSVSSEHQFLNLMEKKISLDAGYPVLKQENPTLANLLYFQKILEMHIRRLEDNIKIIKDQGGLLKAKNDREDARFDLDAEQKRKAAAATEELLDFFKQTLRRAENLKSTCNQGMAVIMNNAMLAESRRAIFQAKGVAKLTLIAFFYIPLSFVTSFYSMDFKELGTGKLSLWTWFATAVPIFVFTLCFAVMDGPTLRRMIQKLKHGASRIILRKEKQKFADDIYLEQV